MSPIWDPNALPERSGFYSVIMAAVTAILAGDEGGIVAVPIVHDWGPEGQVVEVSSTRDFATAYGPTTNTNDYLAVLGALEGDQTKTNPGASVVKVVRHALTGNVAASRNFTNVTPASALTVAAKYKGTKGNDIRITVRDNPAAMGTEDQLLVYDGSRLVETWSFPQTDLAALAAKVNHATDGSNWIAVTVLIDGVALAAATSQALDGTAGANGTIDGTALSDMLGVLDGEPFDIITFPNLTDDTFRATVRAWVQTLNDEIRRAVFVQGGAADETMATANSRSQLSSTMENVVNVGGVTFVSEADGVTERSSAQMTGYIAGIIAGAGIKRGVSGARIVGYRLKAKPTHDELISAINAGTVTFSQDQQGVRLEKERTTYTVSTNEDKPLHVFRSIKSVRTIHAIENMFAEKAAPYLSQANDDPVRADYTSTMRTALKAMEGYALKVGTTSFDLDTMEDNTEERLYPVWRGDMQKPIEQILSKGYVR